MASRAAALAVLASLAAACGPQAHIPLVPKPVEIGADTGAAASLARTLAPVLYQQRDETFPLSRAVAVVHPTERLVAYHLLWQDDVHGAWIPKTVPTDEEIVWVGYDSTKAPTDVWTYWHGRTLHTDWRGKGTVAIDVQWGKHGSLPGSVIQGDLPAFQTLNVFYALAILGIPDIALGRLSRRGPLCFCHGYRRFREFSRPLPLSHHIDAVAHTEHPERTFRAVFGKKYSRKRLWPWKGDS